MRVFILLLSIVNFGCAEEQPAPQNSTQDSQFLWLEEVKGERATEWVDGQVERTLGIFGSTKNYKGTQRAILDTYNSPHKLRRIRFIGNEVMYIDSNESNPKGVMYAKTINDAKANKGSWRKLIDFDALSAQEGKYLVYASSSCNPNRPNLCMIGLSIDGGDNEEFREFDIATGKFVENGFFIPEGIANLEWHNDSELIYTTTNGDTNLSTSGYSLTTKILKRGQSHENSSIVLKVSDGDDLIPSSFYSDGKTYSFMEHWITYDDETLYYYDGNKPIILNMPLRMEIAGVKDDFLVFKLLQDWDYRKSKFKDGDLLGLNLSKLSDPNTQEVDLIFRPSENQVLNKVAITKSSLSVLLLEDVQTKVLVLERLEEGAAWSKRYISNPGNGSIRFWSNSQHADESIVMVRGFVNPTSIYFMDLKNDQHTLFEKSPEDFNTENLTHEYYFAIDDEGTKIPYQVVGPKKRDPNKRYPVLMYVYAGHGVARTAWYRSDIGLGWLEKGGIFVVANVRGGGEYGASWHQSAVRTKKQQTVDDLATVSKDMFKRNITDSRHLGVYGVSAGGFAACSMLTSYPELINAAICKAPLTDMLRYTQLFAGKSWISEYGDPEIPEERKYWEKHSPFEIIGSKKQYPTPLLIAWKNDNRVHPGHARRMAAKMHSLDFDAYYYESPEGGHGTGTGAVERANIRALEYEYFFQRLNSER